MEQCNARYIQSNAYNICLVYIKKMTVVQISLRKGALFAHEARERHRAYFLYLLTNFHGLEVDHPIKRAVKI